MRTSRYQRIARFEWQWNRQGLRGKKNVMYEGQLSNETTLRRRRRNSFGHICSWKPRIKNCTTEIITVISVRPHTFRKLGSEFKSENSNIKLYKSLTWNNETSLKIIAWTGCLQRSSKDVWLLSRRWKPSFNDHSTVMKRLPALQQEVGVMHQKSASSRGLWCRVLQSEFYLIIHDQDRQEDSPCLWPLEAAPLYSDGGRK